MSVSINNTNRMSHTGLRLVPSSVILNYLLLKSYTR